MFSSHRFGTYLFDRASGRLLKDGKEVSINRKQFLALGLLLDAQGEIVTRAKFFEKVWPDSIVEDSNITQVVFTLRRLLGKLPNGRDYIETAPKAGYRMSADALSMNTMATHPVSNATVQRLPKPSIGTRIFRLLRSLVRSWMAFDTRGAIRDTVELQSNPHAHKRRPAA